MAFPNNSKRTAKLNSGHEIPSIGLRISASLSSSEQEVQDAVKTALQAGYRHLDTTASSYEIESAIGAAIRESDVPREEIFLTAKVASQDRLRVREVLEESLERLGTEYVDLYLMEGPGDDAAAAAVDSNEEGRDLAATWVEMQELLTAEGPKVRSIGVRNFGKEEVESLLGDERCTTHPAVNQIDHLSSSIPSTIKLMATFDTSRGIHTMASISPDSPLQNHPNLTAIAKAKGKTVQQILSRWALHRGCSVVSETLPTSTLEEVQTELCSLDGWGLTVSEMFAIEDLSEENLLEGEEKEEEKKKERESTRRQDSFM